jgi:hypothetical protein
MQHNGKAEVFATKINQRKSSWIYGSWGLKGVAEIFDRPRHACIAGKNRASI